MLQLDTFAQYLASFDYEGAHLYLSQPSRDALIPTLVRLTNAEETYFNFEYLTQPLRRTQTLLNTYTYLEREIKSNEGLAGLELFIDIRIRLIDLYLFLPLKLFTYNDIAVSSSISLLRTLESEKDRLGIWKNIFQNEIESLTNLLLSNLNIGKYNYLQTIIHYNNGKSILKSWIIPNITKVFIFYTRKI
jgi:hypothetical protein